jgi:hypothetical protein
VPRGVPIFETGLIDSTFANLSGMDLHKAIAAYE